MYMEVCGNGYSQNIVTTSLFMTLIIVHSYNLRNIDIYLLYETLTPIDLLRQGPVVILRIQPALSYLYQFFLVQYISMQ